MPYLFNSGELTLNIESMARKSHRVIDDKNNNVADLTIRLHRGKLSRRKIVKFDNIRTGGDEKKCRDFALLFNQASEFFSKRGIKKISVSHPDGEGRFLSAGKLAKIHDVGEKGAFRYIKREDVPFYFENGGTGIPDVESSIPPQYKGNLRCSKHTCSENSIILFPLTEEDYRDCLVVDLEMGREFCFRIENPEYPIPEHNHARPLTILPGLMIPDAKVGKPVIPSHGWISTEGRTAIIETDIPVDLSSLDNIINITFSPKSPGHTHHQDDHYAMLLYRSLETIPNKEITAVHCRITHNRYLYDIPRMPASSYMRILQDRSPDCCNSKNVRLIEELYNGMNSMN